MGSNRDWCRGNQVGRSKKKKKQKKKQKRRVKRKIRRRSRKKGKMMEVKKVAEKWEIWDEKEEAARLEGEAKKMVPEKCYSWIKVFRKKQLERMPMRKVWDYAIDMKEGFISRKGKVYPLSREEREKVREFIWQQLREGYIRPSKSPQTAPVFFMEKKDGKKWIVQDYRYLNE